MKDSFYTSTFLAEILVNYVGNHDVNTVADFCVGGGELLRAAQTKWNKAQYYGIDISNQAISSLSVLHPEWLTETCDFLDKNSRSKCSLLKNMSFDLVLLNPPFTCKGSTINKVVHNDVSFNVSTAMLFLVESLKYLKKNGVLFAILPISAAYSQKDRKIWEVLVNNYNLSILEERDKQSFRNCNPNIILVSLNSYVCVNPPQIKEKLRFNMTDISIFRGKLSMYEVKESAFTGKPLIHSTNLKNNIIDGLKYNVNRSQSEVTGPAVLIHRVGNPNMNKICIIPESVTYVLSDCVIALKTKTQKDSTMLRDILFANWKDFISLYKGTGAKYITIERLKLFLGLKI